MLELPQPAASRQGASFAAAEPTEAGDVSRGCEEAKEHTAMAGRPAERVPVARFPTKNTFIDFEAHVGRALPLRRCRSDSLLWQRAPAEPDDANTASAAGREVEAAKREPAPGDGDGTESTTTGKESSEEAEVAAIQAWRVHASTFSSSATSVTTRVCFQVGSRSASFVASIIPCPVYQRSGSFKKAGGRGYIQVTAKDEKPVDAWLLVAVTVGAGAAPRRVRHNFARNWLLRFPGEFDFGSATVDTAVFPRSLTVTFEISSSRDVL